MDQVSIDTARIMIPRKLKTTELEDAAKAMYTVPVVTGRKTTVALHVRFN